MANENNGFHASISSNLTIGKTPNTVTFKLEASYPNPDGLTFKLVENKEPIDVAIFADWLEAEPFNLQGFKEAIPESLLALKVKINNLDYSTNKFQLDVEIIGNGGSQQDEITLLEGLHLSDVKFGIGYQKANESATK